MPRKRTRILGKLSRGNKWLHGTTSQRGKIPFGGGTRRRDYRRTKAKKR